LITKLKIKNFRCFKDHELSFNKLTIMVGHNNVGKSSIVDALKIISFAVSKYEKANYIHPDPKYAIPLINRGFRLTVNEKEINLKYVFYRLGDAPAILKAYFSNDASIEINIYSQSEIFAMVFNENDKLVRNRKEAAECKISKLYVLPPILPLLEEESILQSDYVKDNINSYLSYRHFRNQIYLFKDEHYSEFKRLSSDTWPRLTIQDLKVRDGNDGRQLQLLVRDNDFVGEIGWMGHGLQMWLQTMWFLVRHSKDSVIILDEPDVYMHADLQRRIVRLMKCYCDQTIIATHSVEIMSEVAPENILIVNREKRKSKFATSLPIVQMLIDNMGGIQNIHLARIWNAKRIIFVEGHDIHLLKVFYDKLFPDDDISIDFMPNFILGGWDKWNNIIGSTMVLRDHGNSIVVYCILDRDYRPQHLIDERINSAKKNNIELHLWKRKEIENYTLSIDSIVRIINKSQIITQTSDCQVKEELTNIAKKLKDDIEADIAKRIQEEDKGLDIKTVMRDAKKHVKEAYDDYQNIIDILPGKKAISKLSEWSKKHYNISLSTMSIAREMTKSEIPREVIDVLSAIRNKESFS